MLYKFKENSRYFLQGEYVIDDTLMFLYRNDDLSYSKSMEIFKSRPIYKSKLKRIFVLLVKRTFFSKSIYINNQEKTSFQGSVFFIGVDKASNGKVFDFINQQVLTMYFSKRKYNEILEAYRFFKPYFNLPSIISYSSDPLIIQEELIDHTSYKKWTKEDFDLVIKDIFERYTTYFQCCSRDNNYSLIKPVTILQNIQNADMLSEFITAHTNDDILRMDLPLVRIHGDLWIPNILLTRNKLDSVYYIDYEFSDAFLFFYDIFWFIHDQVVNHSNHYFLFKYVTGEYDDDFKSLFSTFHLNFEKNNRLDYLNIYYINVYMKRCNHLHQRERMLHLNNFKDIYFKAVHGNVLSSGK